MLVLALIAELIMSLVEFGPLEVLLTLLALACTVFFLFRGIKIWKYNVVRIVESRKQGNRFGIVLSRTNEKGVWILDLNFIEFVLLLHVVVTPPWFHLIHTDEYFYYGYHIIAFTAMTVHIFNARYQKRSAIKQTDRG